jgi:hypothetical protein
MYQVSSPLKLSPLDLIRLGVAISAATPGGVSATAQGTTAAIAGVPETV